MTRRQFIVGGIVTVPCLLAVPQMALANPLYRNEEVIPTVSHNPENSFFNGAVPYSWYASTLYFGGKGNTIVKGSKRYYDGSSIGIEMTCSKSMGKTCDDYFSVELWRGNVNTGTYVGSAGFAREGFTKATWSNVGSGEYSFKFVKCDDEQTISSTDVAMYSW